MYRTYRTSSIPRIVYSLTLLLTFALVSIGALLVTNTLSSHARPAASITVCVSGPPTCDFASIQAAINAATVGDEIIVAAGVYSQALTLRDHLTIRGADSATTTLIAATGPIVRASNIQSVTLSHLDFNGRGMLTSGLVMTDADITLNHITIRDLASDIGGETTLDGKNVTGLALFGNGSLIASNLHIQRLIAGNGAATRILGVENSLVGGDAIGIATTGIYTIQIEASSITDLSSGDAGGSHGAPYYCSGVGGRAIGIMASDSIVQLDGIEVRNIRGGAPCSGMAIYCDDGAGSFAGVLIHGGQLTVTDSTITGLYAQAGHGSPLNVAILAEDVDVVELKNVSLNHNMESAPPGSDLRIQPASADSPFCPPPPLNVHSISVRRATSVEMDGLTIRNVIGYGPDAEGIGVFVDQADALSLSNSTLSNVHGGYSSLTARGISLAGIHRLLVNAITVEMVEAQSAPPQFYYAYGGDRGGSAVGFIATDIESGEIVGNIIWRVVAGQGTSLTNCPSCTGKSGGDASGLDLLNAHVTLAHNTIVGTVPGAGGEPSGEAGNGYGIKSGEGDVQLTATILARHPLGILRTSGSILSAQNNFWENETNTSGVEASPTDLDINPGFVDIDTGDLHLRTESALIDLASEYGAASAMLDIDGQPRPLDGNGDGLYRADIGADERFAVQDVLHLQVAPDHVMANETVQVLAVIENPSLDTQQTGVTFESVLPPNMTLVYDSLLASHGAVSATPLGEPQRVTWTGQLPVQRAVVIRYGLRLDAGHDPMEWVTLQASTTGDYAEMTHQAEVDLLTNPIQTHFPLIHGAME